MAQRGVNGSREGVTLPTLLAAALLALAGGAGGGARGGGGRLGAQVVLNELLAENVASFLDEEGDSEDWLELYNAGPTAADLGGWSLTEDPALAFRWTFPSVELPAGGRLVVFLSGKDRFVPPPGVLSGSALLAGFQPTFVAEEDEWRYVVADPAGSGPPAGWTGPDFDDAAWLAGRSGFGYGDGDDSTELAVDTTAVFTRTRFAGADPTLVPNLVLKVDYDDGFVAYLNGVRVAGAYAPAGDPTFQSEASGKREAGSPEFYDLSQHLGRIRAGTNVLAVVGLNDVPSTDMSLIPALGTVPTYLHTSFKLDKEGQYVGLVDPSGALADSVDFPVQTRDHSYGRAGDGGAAWGYFIVPTPGEPNGPSVLEDPIPDAILFTPGAGRQPGPVDVAIAPNLPGGLEIRYTTDGSPPASSSALYTSPVRVSANTVLRAAGFRDGVLATPVAAASYFFGGAFALPVMSVSMDPADYNQVHMNAGASGRGSEREAFLEYLEGGVPVVSAGFGLRLHGGASRGGDFETKKSYKGYFRGVYGAPKLEYPIIPDTHLQEFDKLVLRAGFNDCFRTSGGAAYIRDQLIRDLHLDMGAIASHGSWCNLFVNMKYRGVYNVVERMDEEFLYPYTGDRDWDVVKTGDDVLVGTSDEWNRLRTFVTSNDLSNEGLYQQAAELVDLENFTSYFLLNVWAQNHDWPHNNWYAARPRRPDGKWIFLSWDAEFGIGLIPGGYTSDTFEFALTQGGSLRTLLNAYLASPTYRAYFIEEADRHRYGALSPTRVIPRIRALRDRIKDDMPEESALFGRSVASWSTNVAACEAFAQNRGTYFFNSIANSARFSFPKVTLPRIVSVSPASVLMTGVEQVTLTGARLSTATEVYFNDVAASEKEVRGGGLRVKVPFDLALEGEVLISAREPGTGRGSEAPGPIQVAFPRPLATEVTPSRGRAGGGDPVRIPGIGFLPGVEVRFGGAPAREVRLVDGTPSVLEVVTPPGRGVVDVLVSNRVPGGEVPARAKLEFRYSNEGFLRGDVNADGQVDISDAIRTLGNLFSGDAEIPCLSAADANDSGRVDISDPVSLLEFLFQGGEPPPVPFPDCGEDPTPDDIGCGATVSCGG
ncbi:MAG: CotH kinase family protein [Planctomycetes bacterium]|nr:CotH kinase family protein [Planctomycetota bacterium]